MGKALAIAAIAFIALGTYYNGIRSSTELDTRRRVSNNQYDAISRGSALAGVNVAKQALAAQWKSFVHSGVHQGGAYAVQIKANPKRATIESMGTIRNAGRQSENYSVNILLERRQKLPPDPPKWMQYAIATDSDISLKGDPSIELGISGDEGYELNANIHTNGSMSITGNSLNVEGFGTYSNTFTGNKVALETSFNPNYNPTGLEEIRQTDPLDIPDFTAVDYPNYTNAYGEAMVDQMSTGEVTLSGSYDFGGTREDPYVWYVDGNVSITDNTVVDGYVIFVVSGNTTINGDFRSGDSGYSTTTESSLALYTNGNMALGGNATVEASLFVGGDAVVAHGTPTITGNLVTNGVIDFKGTPNVHYRPTSTALTQFWQGYEYTFHINGYNEQ